MSDDSLEKSPSIGPSIQCQSDGPYLVKNLSQMKGFNGKTIELKKAVNLCRCGKSKKRPFCDATHSKIGFSGANQSDGKLDKRESYQGQEITIHDNRGVCSHAGKCTNNLPAVFMMSTEPWIGPDNADKEAIARTVRMCPSGALSHSIGETEFRDQEEEPLISIAEHGPYLVSGGVKISGLNLGEGASEEHYTLCRCGASKNKPRCDGSHWHINYRDDDKYRICLLDELEEGQPFAAQAEGVELVVIRKGEEVSVFSGKCLHQGALLSGGFVEDGKLVCPLHGWSYDLETGVKNDDEGICLKKFQSSIEEYGAVMVDLEEIRGWKKEEDSADDRVVQATPEEPMVSYIHELAKNGLKKTGSHGPMAAMGVPRNELPRWEELQLITAQLHKLPHLDDLPVGTELVIGPKAQKPLRLDIPIFVSDMSFGALSFEAKIALSKGAEMAGTGICSGEGGMLEEERAENSRYFYELASAQFGFSWDKLKSVQAFHFKGGQAAKTGTGGHLPGIKVTEKIAEVRGLQPGKDAISPARFPDFEGEEDFIKFAEKVREVTGGIPIGFKLSAQHIEDDLDSALRIGVDYIILDGRGGGTGAAPLLFRENISVPTLAALPRARRHLAENGGDDITLIVTGGLRTPADFAKALALGADGIAISNSAMQAIGCIATRACHTDNCPVGIATQKEHLRALLNVDQAAARLERFLKSSVSLMAILARACSHDHLNQFTRADLTTFNRELAYLTGVQYGGVTPL